jgi:cyclopropane fatty-acyl-phospholipid synthase-like methyltransferase
MKRFIATSAFVLCFCAPAATQQTSLTEAQLKSAEREVPELVKLLELKAGMTVADVGAGFGAWTMRLARWIGPEGRVFATDIGAAQLTALRESVKREGLNNVTVIEGGVNATNLPPLCCDAIMIRDAYHHFTNPDDVVKSLAASLKRGGRLAVIDFPPRPNSEVPSGVPANRRGHGVPPDVVQQEVGAALTYVRTISSWSPDSEPASLFLVLFRKP